MGMNKKLICAVCGVAFCGNVLHEAHQDADFVARPLAEKPKIDTKIFQGPRHGNEPESPTGPLHFPSVVTSTSTATSVGSPAEGPIFPDFDGSS